MKPVQPMPVPAHSRFCAVSLSSISFPYPEADYRCQDFQHRLANTLRQMAQNGTQRFFVRLTSLPAVWCAEALVRLRITVPCLYLVFCPADGAVLDRLREEAGLPPVTK